MAIRFEWDKEKARENAKKHGVTFEEAATVFGDPLARIHDDPDHSQTERREIIVGHSSRGRLLLIAFTERKSATRLISARETTSQERKDYEEARQK